MNKFNNFNFDALDRRVRKASSVNLDSVTYARNIKNNFYYIVLILCIADLTRFFVARYISVLAALTLMFLIIYLGIFFTIYRVGGFGMSYKTLIYVKYSYFLHRELKVEEIQIDNIHYVDVKNLLLSTTIRIKYVDNKGKASELKVAIPKHLITGYRYRFKNNRKDICSKLADLQKVLDKGDF